MGVQEDLATDDLASDDFRYRRGNFCTCFPKNRGFVTFFQISIKNFRQNKNKYPNLEVERVFSVKTAFKYLHNVSILRFEIQFGVRKYTFVLYFTFVLNCLATDERLTARFSSVARSSYIVFSPNTC